MCITELRLLTTCRSIIIIHLNNKQQLIALKMGCITHRHKPALVAGKE
jgi:hypothetical protein